MTPSQIAADEAAHAETLGATYARKTKAPLNADVFAVPVKLGLCGVCGKCKPAPGRVTCPECLARAKVWKINAKERAAVGKKVYAGAAA